MSNELLRLEQLSIDYKVRDGYLSAVKDVSFHIDRGEIFAVVGESGCGKSTIAHSIMRLLDKNARVSGNILFDDTDLQKLSDKEITAVRGRDIGMIFQNPLDSLNPVYTTGTQVNEAIMLDGVSRLDGWKKVIELYRSIKMPDPEKRAKAFPHEMSGGMRQRVMIAMMISRNPALLIADEPTTALDVTIEAQILEIISQLKSEFNTAIMLITHNFGLVAEVADRVAIMYAGELVEQGEVYAGYERPIHPSPRLLMKALPRGTKRDARLQTIDGTVPRLTEKKPGCRFANRCPMAREICGNQDPAVWSVSATHTYRCHFAEEGV